MRTSSEWRSLLRLNGLPRRRSAERYIIQILESGLSFFPLSPSRIHGFTTRIHDLTTPFPTYSDLCVDCHFVFPLPGSTLSPPPFAKCSNLSLDCHFAFPLPGSTVSPRPFTTCSDLSGLSFSFSTSTIHGFTTSIHKTQRLEYGLSFRISVSKIHGFTTPILLLGLSQFRFFFLPQSELSFSLSKYQNPRFSTHILVPRSAVNSDCTMPTFGKIRTKFSDSVGRYRSPIKFDILSPTSPHYIV